MIISHYVCSVVTLACQINFFQTQGGGDMKKSLSFILCFCLVGIFFTANAGLNPELEQLISDYKAVIPAAEANYKKAETDFARLDAEIKAIENQQKQAQDGQNAGAAGENQTVPNQELQTLIQQRTHAEAQKKANDSNSVHIYDKWVQEKGGRLVELIRTQYLDYWPKEEQDTFEIIKNSYVQYATHDIPISHHAEGWAYNLPTTEEAQKRFNKAIDHIKTVSQQAFGSCNMKMLLAASFTVISSYSDVNQKKVITNFVKRILDTMKMEDGAPLCLAGHTNRVVAFLIVDTLQYRSSELLVSKRERVVVKYKGKREYQQHSMFEPQIIEALAEDIEFREVLNKEDIQQIVNEFKSSHEGQQWFDKEIQPKITMVNPMPQVTKQEVSCQRPQITVTTEDVKAQLMSVYKNRMTQNTDMIALAGEDYVKQEVKEDIKKGLSNQYAKGKRILEILSEQECREFIDSLDQPVASEIDTLEQKLAALK